MSIGRGTLTRRGGTRAGDDRRTTVAAAAVGVTLFTAVLSASQYRVTPAGTGFSWELLVPFAVVLPVTALVAVVVSLSRRPSLWSRAAVHGGLAAGLYTLMAAMTFLLVANLRAFVAGVAPTDRLFGELLTGGVVLLLSFPAASAVGLAVGLVSAVTLGRLG